jgi:hypothetical protein
MAMNERIKELVLEAAYGNIDPNGPFTPEEFNNFTAKFAELIVQECQTVVEWAINVDSTIDRVPVLIKEHFGVEE